MLFPSFMSSTSNNDSEMHDKLNKITTKLQQLYDKKEKLGLTVKDGRSKDKNRSYQISLFDPGGIVGWEDEKQVLLQELLGGEPGVILESIAGERQDFADLNLFHGALKNQFTGKRFLLVSDDVWSDKTQDSEILAGLFHTVASGSKIIMASRKENLLHKVGYNNPYLLNKMSDDDVLSLFVHYVLGGNNFDSHQTLRPYGEVIVKKCGGLPLALKVDEEKWKKVYESKIWTLKDERGILPALRLSYQELLACLKQLFAYTCLFPKNCVFEKEDLILLWMAKEFLHETTEKSMEAWVRNVLMNDESLFMMQRYE